MSDSRPGDRWTALRDNQEKVGFWNFDGRTRDCAGTEVVSLFTADYTVKGLEDVVLIERKRTASELAGCIFLERFADELERMKNIPFAYVICEFHFGDLVRYPHISSVPYPVRKKVKVTGAGLLKQLSDLEQEYPHVRWHFAGPDAKTVAAGYLKRAVEYAKKKLRRKPTPPAEKPRLENGEGS